MKISQKPVNEEERIKSLKELQILDTALENSYEEVTWLAAQVCEVPICLISLLDETRQWFKSRHGLNAESTSRDFAFCSHAILGRDIFEIEDSRIDERFADNPLVTGSPNVVFYAGTQLLTPNDLALGTLCVIDNKPKKLNEFQKKTLKILGNQVSHQFELRKNLHKLASAEATQAALAISVSYAHEINNPLTIAAVQLQLGKDSLDVEIYDRIKGSHDRISNAIVQIQETLKTTGIDLTDYIPNTSQSSKMIKI